MFVLSLACVALASVVNATPVAAQESARVAAARQLMEAGAFAAAEDSLRARVRDAPRDATAQWLLGRVLYWLERAPEALERYRTAISLLPGDPWVRVEYAEVLMAVGERGRARALLEAVVSDPVPAAAEADALALLGTLAYWRGDHSAAARWFEAALERVAGHGRARAQLGEIRAATRPWTRASAERMDDNQPYRRSRVMVEAGAYPTPLWSVSAGVAPWSLEGDASAGALVVRAGADGYVPALRLEVSGGIGAWLGQAADAASGAWTGSGAVALRLPADVSLRAKASRSRYLATPASVDMFLLVHAVELGLGRAEAPGWAGEVLARREHFPDGNVVRTRYGWLLAPVLPAVRVGYSAAWQDADESRWTPTPAGRSEGRYDPYFTPEDIRIHAALAELTIGLATADIRVDGSYGFHALERAPVSGSGPPVPGASSVQFIERGYSPWRLRAEVVVPLLDGLRLRLAGERQRTTYYQLDHLTLTARYTFRGATVVP